MAPVYPNDKNEIAANLLLTKRGADMATDVAGHLRTVVEAMRETLDALAGCETLGEDDPLCDVRDRVRAMGWELERMMGGVAGAAQLRGEAVTMLTKLMAEVADAAKEAA